MENHPTITISNPIFVDGESCSVLIDDNQPTLSGDLTAMVNVTLPTGATKEDYRRALEMALSRIDQSWESITKLRMSLLFDDANALLD